MQSLECCSLHLYYVALSLTKLNVALLSEELSFTKKTVETVVKGLDSASKETTPEAIEQLQSRLNYVRGFIGC